MCMDFTRTSSKASQANLLDKLDRCELATQVDLLQFKTARQAVVAHTFKPSTWEAETGRSLHSRPV